MLLPLMVRVRWGKWVCAGLLIPLAALAAYLVVGAFVHNDEIGGAMGLGAFFVAAMMVPLIVVLALYQWLLVAASVSVAEVAVDGALAASILSGRFASYGGIDTIVVFIFGQIVLGLFLVGVTVLRSLRRSGRAGTTRWTT